MEWLRRAAAAAALAAASGCVIINDSRRGLSAEAPSSDDGVLLEETTTLEHTLWDLVLTGNTSPEGVAYDQIRASGEHRFVLRQYLELLGAVDATGLDGQAEKLAYYGNVYNATVVEGVLNRLEEGPGFRVDQESFAFFDEPLVSLGGFLVSLNVLEHALLRGDLGHDSASVASLTGEPRALVVDLHADLWGGEPPDPRIHFLLNCASRSCPPLQPRALRGESFDAVADEAAEEFLLDAGRGAGPNGISLIFDWFREDFRRAGFEEPEDFIAGFRSLEDVDGERFLPYDWALNSWSGP